MYSYVLVVGNSSDELVRVSDSSLTETLNHPNGVVTFRENDSFTENESPIDAIPAVADVQRTQYGWSFTLTRESIENYMTHRYNKWKEAASQYAEQEFFQLNNQFAKLMAEAFSDEQGDLFYLPNGTVMTVQDFFRQILAEMDSQHTDAVTKYINKIYSYHW